MATPQLNAGRTEGPATFETVWASLQETDRIIKEIGRKQEETDRIIKETDQIVKETAQQMKETDKRVGALTNRFGEVVEYMVVPSLVAKFNELGYTFQRVSRDIKIRDSEHNIFTEVDAFLENGDYVMVVETKSKPDIDDIKDHITRMEKLRAWADLHTDTRKYYGAIAGVVMDDSPKTYALQKGLYVVEPSGETFTITSPAGVYTPKVW
jgi:hypothetical protein